MGGLLILWGPSSTATLLWMDLGDPGRLDRARRRPPRSERSASWTIGRKVRRKHNRGLLAGRAKLLLPPAVTLAAALAIQHWHAGAAPVHDFLTFPFLKNAHLELGILFVPFVSVVMVGSSNAVNLTDGLDGLAIGAVGIAAATYALLTYVAGNVHQSPATCECRSCPKRASSPCSAARSWAHRWGFCGSTVTRRTCSWETWARFPGRRNRDRGGHGETGNPGVGRSWAVSSSWKPAR